jgi:RND family efflux transporter MFP subunit
MNSMIRRFAVLTLVAVFCPPAAAQGPPPSPVRYTEAKEHAVRRMIQLPGSVESRTVSLVAGEVAGLVEAVLVRDGDTVRKGQVLARLSTANLELRLAVAAAQLKEAESRLGLARVNLDRARGLFESSVVSRQDLDNATYEFAAWEGRVEELKAEIARVKRDIEVSEIRTPFAGLVVAKRTEVGQWLPVGGPVAEVLSLGDLEVRVDVPERYFSTLNPGASAEVIFDALPGFKIQGRVSAVIPSADPQARTFPLKVRIPNSEGRIGAGMVAHVSFPAGEEYRATVVPKDALVTQGDERFVFLINGDSTISRVSVETGDPVGSWVVVRGDVQPGQKVVTRGNERLMPGAAVTAEPMEYTLP